MSVTPSPIAGFAGQFFDNNGQPLSGGKIFTYAAGTTLPQATFTSASGTTPHANPIILNSAGRVPGGEIWLTDGLVYKFVIETSTNVLIGTFDNITGVNSNFINYTVQEEVITATAGQTVFNLTTITYAPGTNSLSVYIDGVNQYVGDSYLETDGTTVTFTAGLHVGAEVKFTTAIQTTTGAVDASIVSYDPPFANSVPTNVEAKLSEYVSVKDFGAVGDGVADDTAAIQAAIDAVNIGGTVYLFGGVFKTTGEIFIGKTISLVGEDARIGNVVNPYASKACIITDSPTDAAGILVNDCAATLRNFVLVNGPNTPAVRVDGIRAQGGNGSVKIYDLLVEGYHTGIRSTTNYYNTIENTSIAFCDECLRFDNCYNVNLVGVKLRTNDTPVFTAATYGLMLFNGSQVNMFGGAIESFNDAAVYMPGSVNSIALFGVYFESWSTTNASEIVQADSSSSVVAVACHVYMTHSERFISVLDNGSVGVRVYSRNNRIVYPTNTKTVDVYVTLAGDSTASWDIAGDNWANPIGPNVTYLSSEGVGGDGDIKVKYPVGHPDFLKPVNTNPYVQNAWDAPPTLPVSSQTGTELPTLVSFANVGLPLDDPLGLRLTPWGFSPYMTVYQNGDWEKVGTRLPNQVNSTASNVAGIVSDFNALLQKMRDNGIMI